MTEVIELEKLEKISTEFESLNKKANQLEFEQTSISFHFTYICKLSVTLRLF